MNGLDFPRVGVLPSGPLDAITDVGDVRVGHCTLDEGDVHTGVTVVLPNGEVVSLGRKVCKTSSACRLPYIQWVWQERRLDADG